MQVTVNVKGNWEGPVLEGDTLSLHMKRGAQRVKLGPTPRRL